MAMATHDKVNRGLLEVIDEELETLKESLKTNQRHKLLMKMMKDEDLEEDWLLDPQEMKYISKKLRSIFLSAE